MNAKPDPNGGNRTKPSTEFYRAVVEAIEQRRLELGLSMKTCNDISGAADYYYSKMIYPDTPTGRQARWETIDEFVKSLFGMEYRVQIIPGGEIRKITLTALSEVPRASEKAINIRHWRHSRHFADLGRKGGIARKMKLSPEKRKAIAKKANRAWQRARRAKKQGAAHKAANAETRAT